MSDKRRQARFWISIASIPLVLLALALVGKWVSMYVFAQGTIAAHVDENAGAGISHAEKLEHLNWFEPWKAPYDKGVALADGDRLVDARAAFEQALADAEGLNVCPVRTNLGLVIERMGDQARAAAMSRGRTPPIPRGIRIKNSTTPKSACAKSWKIRRSHRRQKSRSPMSKISNSKKSSKTSSMSSTIS